MAQKHQFFQTAMKIDQLPHIHQLHGTGNDKGLS